MSLTQDELIRTLRQMANTDLNELERRFGFLWGEALWQAAEEIESLEEHVEAKVVKLPCCCSAYRLKKVKLAEQRPLRSHGVTQTIDVPRTT